MNKEFPYILFFVFLISFTKDVRSQNDQLNIVRIIPPSPTAAGLAKFGDIPVSYYTGIPNINIPIYTAKNNDISVPISLSYHAGGIKVDEEASWVGLGWNLSCGGVITRMVRGMDDIPPHGLTTGFPDSYLPSSIDAYNFYSEPTDNNQYNYDLDHLNSAVLGDEDTEPDVFVYNFNGRSGKFILNKRANVNMPLEPVLLSQEDLKIEVSFSSATSNYQWVITDEGGTKYFFSTTESSISRTGMADDEEFADMNSFEGTPDEVVSSWYLDKIVTPTGNEILFSYASSYPTGRGTRKIISRSQIKKHVTELYGAVSCTVPMNEFFYFSTYTEIHDVYLKEITFPNGKIEFNTSNREDIEPVPNSFNLSYAQKLDSINIYAGLNNSYTLLKKYLFKYSYFEATSSGYSGKRLKLDSLIESDGVNNRPPYLFTYNQQELPAKDSKSIDHWGYYNAANNASINEMTYGDHSFHGTLIPPARLYFPQTGEWRSYKGADRGADQNAAQACILTSITYPTKGVSTFEYELNDYYQPTMKIVERGEARYLTKAGPLTQIPNNQPDTFQIEFPVATRIKMEPTMQCVGSGECITEPDVEIEYDAAEIWDITGGTPVYQQGIGCLVNYDNQENATSETYVDLDAGKYAFKVLAGDNFITYLSFSWNVVDTLYLTNQVGGGLRIKKLTTFDGISHTNDQVTSYSYTALSSNGGVVSSGKLMTRLGYTYEEEKLKKCITLPEDINAKGTVRMSSSLTPFSGSAQGNAVGYGQVTEIKGNKEKTVYEYINAEDVVSYPMIPGVPSIGYFGNGLLTDQTIYSKGSDGSFKVIKKIHKTYKEELQKGKSVKAMRIPSQEAAQVALGYGYMPTFSSVKFYDIVSGWIHPESEQVRVYSQDSNNFLETETTFSYDNPNWLQVTSKTLINSANKTRTTSYKYPYDFSGDAVCSKLVATHQISKVIEQIDKVDLEHVQSTKNNYAEWPGNLLLPATVAVKTGTGAYETRLRNYAYSPEGLLLSQSMENDVIHSYKWGYNNQYPVAEVINAQQNEFYYESFEYGTNLGIVQAGAKTGSKVRQGPFVVNFTIPNPGQKHYMLSYWYRASSSASWIFKSVDYVGPTYTISDGAYIDEVRIYPKDARMSTFTYAPLLGISSESNASNKTTYYEYNSFGELKLIKDQNGKILKQFDYQYQKPVNQ